MSTYSQHFSTRETSQSESIPGKQQVPNSAGGYAFAVDDFTRLERFLILGNEGGSYYASERELTIENATCIRRCAQADPARTVNTIVDISRNGRAPKNDPAVFALAVCCDPSLPTKDLALAELSKVCRIGTHLFQFIDAVRHFRGRGRALKRAVQNWYLAKDPEGLAYQMVKYQQRNGWSHRDVLRLFKPVPDSARHSHVLAWACDKPAMGWERPIVGFEKAKKAKTDGEIVAIIEDYDLPREAIPTDFLNSVAVWDALLEKMPMTAMIRNLGKMSSVGLLKPMNEAVRTVVARLGDTERLQKARIHPMAVLFALTTYKTGRGFRGSLTWQPEAQVIDALDQAFYACFPNVEPTGKRHLLALDVSGSMKDRINNSHLSCRDASAAMAMLTVQTEPFVHTVGFTGGHYSYFSRRSVEQNPDGLTELAFSKRQRLDDAVRTVSDLPMGNTDCALPMMYAYKKKLEIDTFVVYTDSETWCGDIHPCQALRTYREVMGIPAKLIVVGMVANNFSIADPDDAGMLDVVGFDTAVPQIMSDFGRDQTESGTVSGE